MMSHNAINRHLRQKAVSHFELHLTFCKSWRVMNSHFIATYRTSQIQIAGCLGGSPYVSLPLLLSPVVIHGKKPQSNNNDNKKKKSICKLLQHAEKSKAWQRCRAAHFTRITAADAVYYRLSDAFTNLLTIITWFVQHLWRQHAAQNQDYKQITFPRFILSRSVFLFFCGGFFVQFFFFFSFLQLLMLTSLF